MATLTIEISADAERRLREEAARRNASAEVLASRLLVDQLRFPIPADSGRYGFWRRHCPFIILRSLP